MINLVVRLNSYELGSFPDVFDFSKSFSRLVLRRNVLDDQKRENLMNACRLFLIHPMFFLLIIILWHNIKKKRNWDPMEKIWIKKELYI